jgi:hypothetical protein
MAIYNVVAKRRKKMSKKEMQIERNILIRERNEISKKVFNNTNITFTLPNLEEFHNF